MCKINDSFCKIKHTHELFLSQLQIEAGRRASLIHSGLSLGGGDLLDLLLLLVAAIDVLGILAAKVGHLTAAGKLGEVDAAKVT